MSQKTKANKIVTYIDLAIQTLLVVIVILFLANPPEIRIETALNSLKISNLADLLKELTVRGSLNLFFILISFTASMMYMLLPLFLLWIYQIFTAVVLSLIFKNIFNLIYGLAFVGLIIVFSIIDLSNTIFPTIVRGVLFVFFVFPFLFYGKRIYDGFIHLSSGE